MANLSIRVSGQRGQLVSRLAQRTGWKSCPGARRTMGHYGMGDDGVALGDLWRPVPLPGAKGLKTTVINMGAN